MIDLLLGQAPSWVGLLAAFGVAIVLLALMGLLGQGDRLRAVAGMVGAAFVGYEVVRGFGGITSIGSFLVGAEEFGLGAGNGRLVADLALALAGLAAGVAAVVLAHARAAEATEDLAADALDALDFLAEDGDEADDAPDPYVVSRERIAAAAPWIDYAALVVATALPALSFGVVGDFTPDFDIESDVTAIAAVYYVLSGVQLAAPLLVVAARRDLADLRVIAAGFALLALRSIVLPIWPEFFTNEFWSAFGIGLSAGLLTAAGFFLVKAAIPDDRADVVTGALIALAVLAVTTVTYTKAQSDLNYFGDIDERFEQGGPDVVFPTEFPVPTDFPFTFSPP